MLATVPSATLFGVEGRPVTVEVHVSNGLPGFTIVGLPDASCRESRDRVRAALLSTGLDWPLRRMTVNLAPSALRKGGAGLDLAIAIALLVAVGVVEAAAVDGHAFVGELGLDGTIRAVAGIVPLVECLTTPAVVVPLSCVSEASLVGRHTVRGARNLREVLAALRGDDPWPEADEEGDGEGDPSARAGPDPGALDLADVRGQRVGRWAVEVAAAGGHHLLMIGPPGAGKTMLARRLPGLLPPLDRDAALETTRIHDKLVDGIRARRLCGVWRERLGLDG